MSALTDVSEHGALRAMRARGLDNAEDLLAFATAERIVATCRWWDRLSGVTPRLLAKRIRDGGVDPGEVRTRPVDPRQDRRLERRERFEVMAARFPVGSTVESHEQLRARRWPDDERQCAGRMVVIEAHQPCFAVRCDGCAFEAAYPVQALTQLFFEKASV